MIRAIIFLFSGAIALTAAPTAPATPIDEPAGERMASVWSGHPVSFALLTERGHQYIAYYDAVRRLTVAGRTLGEDHWTTLQPPGRPGALPHGHASNEVGWDSHNYIRLALDAAGCLHVSGNMHVDPLVYYRTTRPFDVASLERVDRMTGEREQRCSYPVFFHDAAGRLLFRYRDGSSGNGSDLYNIYDPATRSWRRVLDTPVLEGEGHRNAYALDPVLGPDGWFHLVWMWRESPDCSTNHTLSYARSRDLQHWEDSRGRALELPITLGHGDVIDPAPVHGGLINMTFNLGFDANQRPVVVYHRYDAQHHSQIYAARPDLAQPRGWKIEQLSSWNFCWAFSGNGSIAAEVTLGAPHLESPSLMWLDYATKNAGSGRWEVQADTLHKIGDLPPAPPVLPENLLRPSSGISGMEVQTVASRANGRRYILRWETLARDRDEPRATTPPPTELRLYGLPDGPTDTAGRVGS